MPIWCAHHPAQFAGQDQQPEIDDSQQEHGIWNVVLEQADHQAKGIPQCPAGASRRSGLSTKGGIGPRGKLSVNLTGHG
jgi:hypothetical protein